MTSMTPDKLELEIARRRGIIEAFQKLNTLVISSLHQGATSKDIARYLTFVEARDAVGAMLDERNS